MLQGEKIAASAVRSNNRNAVASFSPALVRLAPTLGKRTEMKTTLKELNQWVEEMQRFQR